jgi:hypothetical protein
MKRVSAAILISSSLMGCIIPIPLPTQPPPTLQAEIITLNASTQTKAVAIAGEDKVFGAKYFVWGKYVGNLPQMEANKIALDQCYNGLIKARAEELGGVKKWNFGDQKCELYSFANLPDTTVIPPNYSPPAGAVITKPASTPITTSTPSLAPSLSGTQPNVAPVIANPSTTSNSADINYEKKLQDLKSLLDKGLINKQDYELKKNEILKGL